MCRERYALTPSKHRSTKREKKIQHVPGKKIRRDGKGGDQARGDHSLIPPQKEEGKGLIGSTKGKKLSKHIRRGNLLLEKKKETRLQLDSPSLIEDKWGGANTTGDYSTEK